MNDIDMLKEMFRLQDTLNILTSGEDWKNGVSKNGKKIDWLRCIRQETAEAVDSFPWKHWKCIDSSHNYENLKIEIIDIWHFIISYAIMHNVSYTDFYSEYEDALNTASLLGDIETIEALYSATTISKRSSETTIYLFTVFSHIIKRFKISIEDLYRIYLGKNVLNIFRQDHGYKEGTYIKMWGDGEDNDFMHKVIENKILTYNELYDILKTRYNEVCHNNSQNTKEN